MSDLTRFKQQLDAFLDALKKTAPKKRYEIKARKMTIDTFWQVNARMVVNVFYEQTKEYKDHILKRNEDFFLKDIDIKDAVPDGDVMHVLDLKEIWTNGLSHTSKDNFWKYIQALFLLSEKINAEEMPK